MIPKELIQDRIHNFFGYGNLNSPTWFIGMEEGFDGTLDDLKKRFESAKGKQTLDLQNGLQSKDHSKWFLQKPKLQPTWSKLILILLRLQGKEISNELIRTFQKTSFCRKNSNHCCLELMPLPCRSTKEKHWFYNTFGIEYLRTRRSYLESVMPIRMHLFQNLIKKYSPTIVVFYSFSYLNNWNSIISTVSKKEGAIYHTKQGKTRFFIIPHPTAHGITNSEWIDIANSIKKIANES